MFLFPPPELNLRRRLQKQQKTKIQKWESGNLHLVFFMLTEKQLDRLRGISHLEGGKDLHIVIDELLNRDTELRKKDLSLEDTKQVSSFLKDTLTRGWCIHTNPNILDAITRLHNRGILRQSPETISGLISLIDELITYQWGVVAFVKDAVAFTGTVNLFRRYKKGKITAKEAKEGITL